MGVRNVGVRRRALEVVDRRPSTARPAAQPSADARPLHLRRADAPEYRGRLGAVPFRGGQEPTPTGTGPASRIGTTDRASVTAAIDVTNRNYEVMRRLDLNDDGVLERGEVTQAFQRAGQTRFRNETQDLTVAERRQIATLIEHGAPISLRYRGTSGGRPIGIGADQMRWNDVRAHLYADAAGDLAPAGRIGQGRVRNLNNNDCGPTNALYIHHRHEIAAGRGPTVTHAQADAQIRRMSRRSGTTAPEMAGILNDNFRHSGGRYYTYAQHTVTRASLPSDLARGLSADPTGGVMVPVISTYNEADRRGTRHWLVVTGIEGDNVHYYDPAGPDGAQHERTMPMAELQRMLPRPNRIHPNQIVYGTSVSESAARGALPVGRRIGELEVAGSNPELTVSSRRGLYGRRTDAQAAARRAAAASGEDAIVRREGDGYAVYGISELRDRFGGYWSANTLTDLDSAITDVYMTDPTSGNVRRATSGP